MVLIILIRILLFYSSVHFKLGNYIIISMKSYTLLEKAYFKGNFILQIYFTLYTIFIFTAWRLYIKKSVMQLHCGCVHTEIV